MVKQRGLGQSNQKELTQKGSKHKEEKQSPRAEQQAQHSKQSGVLPCRSRWLGWRRAGPAATPTAQRRCRQTGCAVTSLYGTATSFRTGRLGVLTRRHLLSKPGRSSSVPDLSFGL